MKLPSITVLIPCYNGSKYIDRLFNSLTKQEIGDFDIVVVDDCSKDNSVELLNKWKAKFPKLKVIQHKTNKGIAATRNDLIANVKTEYFFFIDIDDALPKKALYILSKPIIDNKTKYDVVLGKTKVRFYNRHGRVAFTFPLVTSSNFYSNYTSAKKWLHRNQNFVVWGILINKKYWNSLKYRFEAKKVFEDTFISFKMIYKAKTFLAINKTTYLYSRRANSISSHGQYFERSFYDLKDRIYFLINEIKKDKSLQTKEGSACLDSYFLALMYLCKRYTQMMSNPKLRLALMKFKSSIIYLYFVKNKQPFPRINNWWSLIGNLYFRTWFKKELSYWKILSWKKNK